MFLAAVVQMCSTSDTEGNLAMAEDLIRRAAQRGAGFIATPENTNFMGRPKEKVLRGESLEGAACSRFSALAKELQVHLLLGSFNEKSERPDRVFNTSVLFGPAGQRLAMYRKMHLFDADITERVRARESDTILPGSDVIVAETPLAKFGLSICYDLRFGELYRQLVERGAEVLCVPAAFTLLTGRDHWEALLRARAIENQCYVIAPGQWGFHADNEVKESFGHSLIVSPWGHILTMAADGPGIALAEIDLDRVAQVRKAMPVQRHRRL